MITPLLSLKNLPCQLRLRVLAITFLTLAGCSDSTELDPTYARLKGKSINGISAFKEVLESRGHEVKAAWGLDEEVFEQAHVIIRLAERPGPPAEDEAAWFDDWLQADNTNLLIYAPQGVEWTVSYWQQAVNQPEPGWDDRRKEAYRRNLAKARLRSESRKKPAKDPAKSTSWFKSEGFDSSKKVMPLFEWFGEWAGDGLVWPVQNVLNFPPGHSLLKHREKTVISEYGQRIYLADAGFLLNGGLIYPANRQLTEKLVDWFEEEHPECLVVIVSGDNPMADPNEGNALWKFLTTWPSSALAGHLILLGLLGCWSRALRHGPAREPRITNWQQFSLHAMAVGRLLEKSADLKLAATATFERYSKWRNISALSLWDQSRQEEINSDK